MIAARLASTYNSRASEVLLQDDFTLAFELLKRADAVTSTSEFIRSSDERLQLHALTLNNFGCLYKRFENPRPV